ncbi:AAA family ATPase [Candidatus Woesearchaeota archaeon]|nr:AAA family ATPase [Candidatus Woesearchaeota archaeon]
MPEKELKLKVAEAVQDDVNKGIVRLDTGFMHQIGARPGDIIEIEGSRKTIAIADRAYPGDIGLNIIRMDGIIRRNAKTSIGDLVAIQKADVKEGKKVTIAPARKGIIIRASSELFKQGLLGRALMKGDIVALGGGTRRRATMAHSPFEDIFRMLDEDVYGFGFGDIKFLVVDTMPKQPIIVSDLTEVVFNPEAVDVSEEAALEVTYEDIGGLGEEIKKIREMVELPLKHPEIFERLGIEAPKGVLLHGPPGTGKTLLAKAVANETNAHFLLINGPEIMCVDGDTKIFTNPKGPIKAVDLFDKAMGEKIRDDKIKVVKLDEPIKTFSYSKKGNIVKSRITCVAKLRAPSFQVKFSNGNSIICSKNQPFLVYDKGELKWKKLEELKEGQFIARINQLELLEASQKISLHGFEEKDGKQAPKGRNISRSNWVKIPEKTSSDFMEFLGLVMSEGYISDDGITFSNNDPDIRNRYKELLNALFSIKKSKEYPDGRVVVYSKVLPALLSQFGMPPGKKTPVVPPVFYSLPKEEVASFIQGYFDGDGTVAMAKDYPTPKLYSASNEFLTEMQSLMILKLGIATKLNPHKTPKGIMYELVVNGNSGRQKFRQLVNPVSKEKRNRLAQLKSTGRTWQHIPQPLLLIDAIRSKVPYSEYRNNDIYVYGKAKFTLHAFEKLYKIAEKNKVINNSIKVEREILHRKDIAWENIDKINFAGEQELYDFTVDDDSFVTSDLLLLHNSKYYGQSEQNLRKKFEEAEKNAPSIIFIDEIDAIASKREEVHGEVERRVVAQLLALMDGLKSRGKVVVIAASNVPNLLDPALRRPGRFDREIEIGVPSKEGRLDIIKIHTRNMPLSKNVNLKEIAAITHGFVGADLASLCKESAMIVLRRVLPELKLQEEEPIPKELLEKLMITRKDFKEALKVVRPSAMREVLVEVPTIRWDDIGGLEEIKQELIEAVEWPIKHAESFKRLGVKPPKGILLYGAPGTGKTLLAKAVATECEANFIQVKGPELLSKWLGESEKAVREVFKKARQTSPTVIFFDEIDSLAPRRGMSADSHSTERVVNQLLTEMDGLEDLYDVVIIAATNRPDMIDPALLRPGRFDRIVLTPIPDENGRLEIFRVHTTGMPLKDVDIDEQAKKTQGYVGADIEAICREAAILALRKDINAKIVTDKNFEEALKKVGPSVTKDIEEAYEGIKNQFKQVRARQLREEKPSYMG